MSDQASGSRARPVPPSTVIHDVVTGGLEGGTGVLALEPALQAIKKLRTGIGKVENPFRAGVTGRVGAAALVGAGATGLIGALVSMGSKKRAIKKNPAMMEALNAHIEEFRYVLTEDDDPEIIKLPGSSKAHAALQGGLIGAGIGTAAGIGAAVALPSVARKFGAQKVVNAAEKALGGRAGARVKTSLALAGVAGKIGATVGAIQGVANRNDEQKRSLAIARAIREARKSGAERQPAAKKLEAVIDEIVVEFDRYDPMSDRTLRAGVRLDKYQKNIKGREIDRHIHDYIRSAAIGATAGVALPTLGTIKVRAAKGAAAGLVVAGALHAIGHRDEYGEQSEEAKISQKDVPRVAGAATVIGGLVARHRAKVKAVAKVARKVTGLDALQEITQFAAAMPAMTEPKKHHRILEGAAVASLGLPLLKGGARFGASAGRPIVGKVLRKIESPLAKSAAENIDHAGKRIFDYIEGAQQSLNTGANGKVVGQILQNPKSEIAKTLVPHKVARSHYSSFRAGHREAFASMLEEIGGNYQGKVKASKTKSEKLATGDKFDNYMSQMGHALTHFDDLVANKGHNTREALKAVTHDPVHQPLMRRLLPKTGWAPQYSAVSAGAGAIPALAGVGIAATTKKEKRT